LAGDEQKRAVKKPFILEHGLIEYTKDNVESCLPVLSVVDEGRKLDVELLRTDGLLANATLFHSRPSKKAATVPWQQKFSAGDFDLVIVDEAHRFPAPTWLAIIEHFKCNSRIVFVTATPFRSDKKAVCKVSNICYNMPRHTAVERYAICLS
jgi:hypothetical protein